MKYSRPIPVKGQKRTFRQTARFQGEVAPQPVKPLLKASSNLAPAIKPEEHHCFELGYN